MSDFLAVCCRGVREAGALLLDRMGRVAVHAKGQADLVTEADYASQELIRRTILEAFPDHAVLGEEDQPGTSPGPSDSDYRWIVDPLDGTTNFVHQVPHFSVSLALEHRGNLLVGAVYHPAADECYTAEAGQGAYLNGRRIRTSQVSSMSEALAAVGFPSVVTSESPDLKFFLTALEACQAIRRTGSAALNLCYLAAGRFDATWSYCTKIWDVAAGVLMIREAGGLVTSPEGGEFDLSRAHYLAAANPELHAELRELARRAGLTSG
jgi:myo-inositol-1(or 4)-monophosphatase